MRVAVDKTNKKNIRILINWRDFKVNFGTLDFKPDGSLVYAPAFLNNFSKYPILETGVWNDIIKQGKKENSMENLKGVHVSLHPKRNIIHIRQKDSENKDQTISSKKINWFPVIRSFIFLKVISPPLNECIFTEKYQGFKLQIPCNYVDPIEVLIRVFPRNIKEMPVLKNSIYNIAGYCPHYWVCCDFMLTSKRSAPAVLWLEKDQGLF